MNALDANRTRDASSVSMLKYPDYTHLESAKLTLISASNSVIRQLNQPRSVRRSPQKSGKYQESNDVYASQAFIVNQ